MLKFKGGEGRTQAICNAAKEIGATVVCRTPVIAATVKSMYNVATTHVDVSERGLKPPYLYHHSVMEIEPVAKEAHKTRTVKRKKI